ncbi:hypothetical protein CR970_01085 [Candidatus Saccharibacteria bacterium]|nr:MAG: hypothetical protein CR970_01085 [Candidatus Saccharibacteria bacterium]
MATYKVIQDVEADDTLLGPLTPRQVIYAAIVVLSGFLVFKLVTTPAGWVTIFFIPHMVLFAILAAPFGHDQSSEVWLLAKVRFMIKPRKRIWDQMGAKNLVSVMVPRKVPRQLTKGYSQSEVKSRLEALAATIDSRGWAVKNVQAAMVANPTYGYTAPNSDRLIDLRNIPQQNTNMDAQNVPDMMDTATSYTAQNLTSMIDKSTKQHRQQAIANMNNPQANTSQQWFLDNKQSGRPDNPMASAEVQQMMAGALPQLSPDEQSAFLETVRSNQEQDKKHGSNKRLKTILPLSEQQAMAEAAAKAKQDAEAADQADQAAAEAMTPPTDPDILRFADNDDLDVATIARQANKNRPQQHDDEVVISLH